MARASGIELIASQERNPLKTTTYGTGQLIQAAIGKGATTVLVGIGGSATVDGGAGCLQALGAQLLDSQGREIPYGGGSLKDITHINPVPLRKNLQGITIRVLCDVDNPLLGSNGAAAIFGPQKGADAAMVRQLEENLAHFAVIIERDLGVHIQDVPGSGAAGGLSAGLMAVAGAELVSGVQELITACGYDKRLAQGDIDLVITGEGKLDSQTVGGKAPLGIAKEAAKYNIPVVAFAGAVTAPIAQLQEWGIHAAWSIVRQPCTLDEALANAGEWLTEAATNLGNLLALSQQ
jgi:glycerate kinase